MANNLSFGIKRKRLGWQSIFKRIARKGNIGTE